jgi:hypothetical protein
VKKAHRKVHFYLWITLLPALFILAYIGSTGTVDENKYLIELPSAQQGGRLE